MKIHLTYSEIHVNTNLLLYSNEPNCSPLKSAHKLSVDKFLTKYHFHTILVNIPLYSCCATYSIYLSLIKIPINSTFSSITCDHLTHLKSINCLFVLKFSSQQQTKGILIQMYFISSFRILTLIQNKGHLHTMSHKHSFLLLSSATHCCCVLILHCRPSS